MRSWGRRVVYGSVSESEDGDASRETRGVVGCKPTFDGVRVCFTDGYYAPLPNGHRFPMGKFPALHRILIDEGLVRPSDVVAPEPAGWEDLGLVHESAYLAALGEGTLDAKAERRMGLPWSPALVRRSRLATRGTMLALEMAVEDGIAANLAGGMHHGYPGYGEGFCVLNDVAVAVRWAKASGLAERILLIDLDVHQGNGNAAIFAEDPDVFTFSMHGARNFPFKKETSDLDVALPDGLDDAAYLAVLDEHLDAAFDVARPDLVVYLAGVDVVSGDRFGRLEVTRSGLAQRDRRVLEAAHQRRLPVALVLAGGYAKTHELTADLHATVHREARKVYR